MCFLRMAGLIDAQLDVTHASFRVLMCLAKHENVITGFCCPSQETIGKECNMGRTNVSRTLSDLVRDGVLEVVERKHVGKGRTGSFNSYKLNWPKANYGTKKGELGINPARLSYQDDLDLGITVIPEGVLNNNKKESMSDKPDDSAVTDGPLEVAISRIWEIASPTARKRSSKKLIRQRLRTAALKGHSIDDMVRGWEIFVDSFEGSKVEGAYQPAPDSFILKERWQSFIEDDARTQAKNDQRRPNAAKLFEEGLAAPNEIFLINKDMQEMAVRDFQAFSKWQDRWGPKPGQRGCVVAERILQQFGYPTNFAEDPGPHYAELPDDAAFD